MNVVVKLAFLIERLASSMFISNKAEVSVVRLHSRALIYFILVFVPVASTANSDRASQLNSSHLGYHAIPNVSASTDGIAETGSMLTRLVDSGWDTVKNALFMIVSDGETDIIDAEDSSCFISEKPIAIMPLYASVVDSSLIGRNDDDNGASKSIKTIKCHRKS